MILICSSQSAQRSSNLRHCSISPVHTEQSVATASTAIQNAIPSTAATSIVNITGTMTTVDKSIATNIFASLCFNCLSGIESGEIETDTDPAITMAEAGVLTLVAADKTDKLPYGVSFNDGPSLGHVMIGDFVSAVFIQFADGDKLPHTLHWVSRTVPATFLLRAVRVAGTTLHAILMKPGFALKCDRLGLALDPLMNTDGAPSTPPLPLKIIRCFARGLWFNNVFTQRMEKYPSVVPIPALMEVGGQAHLGDLAGWQQKNLPPSVRNMSHLTWSKGMMFEFVAQGIPILQVKDRLAEGVLRLTGGERQPPLGTFSAHRFDTHTRRRSYPQSYSRGPESKLGIRSGSAIPAGFLVSRLDSAT